MKRIDESFARLLNQLIEDEEEIIDRDIAHMEELTPEVRKQLRENIEARTKEWEMGAGKRCDNSRPLHDDADSLPLSQKDIEDN